MYKRWIIALSYVDTQETEIMPQKSLRGVAFSRWDLAPQFLSTSLKDKVKEKGKDTQYSLLFIDLLVVKQFTYDFHWIGS